MVVVLLAFFKYSPEQLLLSRVEVKDLSVANALWHYISKEWEKSDSWNIHEGLLQFFHLISYEGIVMLKKFKYVRR